MGKLIDCRRVSAAGGLLDMIQFVRLYAAVRWLPLPENRGRSASAICRPSRKGRAGRRLWLSFPLLEGRIRHLPVQVLATKPRHSRHSMPFLSC